MEDLASVLRHLDEEFAEKQRLSEGQLWCTPIPDERKVSTVRSFYTAFHDNGTLPICTCAICYQKYARAELEELDWNHWVRSTVDKREGSPFACRLCFSPGEKILGCSDCLKHLDRDVLLLAA